MRTVVLFLAACFCASAQPGVFFGQNQEAPNTPTDSPGAGTYASTQSVTLSDPTAAIIRYTTDGSTPSFTAGTLYSGAFNISVTTTLKAIGCTIDAVCGGVLSSLYTISGGNTFTHVTNAIASWGTASGNSVTVTLTNNPVTGDLVVVGCSTYNNGSSTPPTLTSVTDGNSNSYTVPAQTMGTYATYFPFVAYLASAPSNASKVLTATWSSTTGGYAACHAVEFSYTGSGVTIDGTVVSQQSTLAGGVGGTVTSPTITVNTSNDVVFNETGTNNCAMTVGFPWTSAGAEQLASINGSYYIASSNTAVNYTYTNCNSILVTGIAIK